MDKLDTSGQVPTTDRSFWGGYIKWSDLSPFTQGYVEALFASFRETMTRVDELKRPACTLSDGQIWLLKHGRGGFSRTTLRVPFSGHGSRATNVMCAGLIRRGWLNQKDNGIVEITEAGERALHTAMPLGFSDLAPETLARIIADCEAFQGTQAFDRLVSKITLKDPELGNAGAEFYYVRSGLEDYCHGFKARDWPEFTAEPLNIAVRDFPPLTVQLGGDGKVRFAA